MAKIRRSDLAPQEPPAAPHAALYDQDNDTDFAPPTPAGPEKKRGSLAYTLAMLFSELFFWSVPGCLSSALRMTAGQKTSLPSCSP